MDNDAIPSAGGPLHSHDERRDFAAAHRLPGIVAIAAVVGGASAIAAWALLHLIRLFTNLFFFQIGRAHV